jgi:hypothetical protein
MVRPTVILQPLSQVSLEGEKGKIFACTMPTDLQTAPHNMPIHLQ